MRSPEPSLAPHRIEANGTAIEAGAVVKVYDVKDVDSLPSLDDVPFPSAQAAQERLAPLRVLATGREQRQNGIEMDNCTLADSYINACQAGTTIVAVFDYDGERYNVAWSYCYYSGGWQRGDLSGRSNAPAPPEVHALADSFTDRLAGLEPVAPVHVTPGDRITVNLAAPEFSNGLTPTR